MQAWQTTAPDKSHTRQLDLPTLRSGPVSVVAPTRRYLLSKENTAVAITASRRAWHVRQAETLLTDSTSLGWPTAWASRRASASIVFFLLQPLTLARVHVCVTQTLPERASRVS